MIALDRSPRSPAASWGAPALFAAVALGAIGLAVRTGITVGGGGSKVALVVPLAIPIFVVLIGLALTRFEWFVLVLLVARASLDTTKLTTPPAKVLLAPTQTPAGVPGIEPAGIVAIGFLLAGSLWLAWRRGAIQTTRRQAPLERALSLLLVIWALSIIASTRPLVSLIELVRIAAVVLMLVVLNRLLVKPRHVRRLLVAIFASTVVPLLVAAYQAISSRGRFEGGGFSRIRATFVHPNPFGLYLVFILAMGVALIPHVHGRARLSLGLLLGACGGALMLTYSRTAWICTVLALVVIGLIQSKRLLGAMVIAGIVLVLAVPSVTARFSDLGTETRTSGSSGNSLIWRVNYWTETLPLVKHDPATGIGLKMAQLNTSEAKAPHNDFVRAVIETGILGFAAYLWLLLAMVRTAWTAVLWARPGLERGVAAGFAGCVAAYWAMSLVSNVVSQVVLLWYFFAFAACAIAVSRFGQEAPNAMEPALVVSAGSEVSSAGAG